MNYLELKDTKDYKNIYILQGDKYIINSVIENLAKSLEVSQINISKFNDENFNCLMLVNACNQFSFFNEKRIIVVENLIDEIKTKDKDILTEYCFNPNKDCYLILVDNNNVFSFLKTVEKIECKPSGGFVLNFIKNKFESAGKQISELVCKKLIEFTRSDLVRLELEIKKICDYLGNEVQVTEDTISMLVTPDTELKVFELTTNMANKNVKMAHKILYDMLMQGEPPIKILGLISSFFRRAFYAKISKTSDADLAKELGCKEFAVKKARENVKNFTAKELKNIQNLILEADYNIKSGAMTQENALYYLIMKIAL